MQSFSSIAIAIALLVFFTSASPLCLSTSQPQSEPGDHLTSSSNTVPALPVQTASQICKLDLSKELFGGVNDACGGSKGLDRSRCCPVLAAWLFAAHARTALEVSTPTSSGDLPTMPDDESQRCVNSLQDSLRNRSIVIPQPNASCDPILCFCGIRLHQISSLSCPAAFNVNVSASHTHSYNATPTAAVRNLENSCRNSSYAGCTKCVAALQKLKVNKKESQESDRGRKMFNRDCQLMGLTWLLGRNKTAYIPTVSAVLRAIMYGAHPHESKCRPDQENMPLAVDSLQFQASSSPFTLLSWIVCVPLIVLTLFLK